VHHARLKDIFEELVVIDRPTGLDLKDPSAAGRVGVGVEAFQYLAFASEEHMYDHLAFGGFPFLDSKSEVLQVPGRRCATTVSLCWSFVVLESIIGLGLEERDYSKAEVRRRR